MRLTLIACVFSSFMIASGCAAEQPLIKRSVDTLCVNSAVLDLTLEKYGENPALTMINNRDIAGRVESFATVLFINYETKTWTLAERVAEDLYCVIGIGDQLTPYRPKDFF